MTKQARMFLAMLREGAEQHGIRSDGGFVDGVPHGVWRVWDRRGALRSESEWNRGVPCGRWVTWDADGNVERIDLKGADRVHDDDVLVVLAHNAATETLPV